MNPALVAASDPSVHIDLDAGTSAELFAGGGGLALAMRQAGFRHLLVNEKAPYACKTLETNEQQWSMEPEAGEDVSVLTQGGVEGVDFTGLRGKIDVLAGGPPCQPFSHAGNAKGHDDERDMFPQFFRAMRDLRPRAVVCENVFGILRESFKPYFNYILRQFEAPHMVRHNRESWEDHSARLERALKRRARDATDRYTCHYMTINAADYGVPQIRKRVIIVAFRNDLGVEWVTPAATHSKQALLEAQASGEYWIEHGIEAPVANAGPHSFQFSIEPNPLKRWLTVRDALKMRPALPEPADGAECPGFTHHVGWPGARIYRGHTPNKLDWPAKTVKAGVNGVAGGENVVLLDNGEHRYFTVREVARLMTFPDSWQLSGPRSEQMKQLGNAVPPLLGEVFTRAVAQALAAAKQ